MFDKLNGLGGLLKNMKNLEQMAEDAKSEMGNIEITGESGAGAVRVVMGMPHRCKQVTISPEILQEDPTVVNELVAGAINDALQKLESTMSEKMGDMSQLLGALGGNPKKEE